MTKNGLKNTALAVMTVAFCCCSSEKKGEFKAENVGYESSVLTFDTVGHVNANPANPKFKYSYKLEMPNDGISPCGDSIRLAMIAEATDSRTNDIESVRKKKIESLADMPDEDVEDLREMYSASDEDDIPFVFECEAGKSYEDADIYNSYFRFYSYSGGAHPYSCETFQIWDKANAKRLLLDDIFVDGYESQLTGMILDSLCKIMKVKSHDELVDAGIMDVKDVAPNNSILLTTNTLTFNYAPYEIAAYAVGSIEVKFSFSDLKSLIKTDSPLYKFAR